MISLSRIHLFNVSLLAIYYFIAALLFNALHFIAIVLHCFYSIVYYIQQLTLICADFAAIVRLQAHAATL